MGITVRKKAPWVNGEPILAIISSAEKEEAVARVIKSLLAAEPGIRLLVSISTPSDVEEMEAQAKVDLETEEGPQLLMEEKRIRPGGV